MLELEEQAPPEPKPPHIVRDPHAPKLCRRSARELEPPAAHRLAAEPCDEEDVVWRMEVVVDPGVAPSLLEAGIETTSQLGEVRLEAPATSPLAGSESASSTRPR